MSTEQKKILYFVEAMGGGVFTYIVDLANELADENDMYIAYALRPQTPPDYREYFDKRIHLIEVKNFGREINLWKEFKAIYEVRKIAAEVKPDIIHLHSSKAGLIGRVAFCGSNLPLYYTPHGYSFLMQSYKPLKRFLFRIIEFLCAKSKCITISCSFGEHQETLKLTKRAAYVNNAVNTDKLQKLTAKIEKKEHPFTVFTLGRIFYQKKPETFNRIAVAMPDIKFLWIGDGELACELKAPNIEVTGWIERDRALSMAVNADMFLLTSLWEGLPMSLLEAMFMKKPCAVSDVIGNHDVIHNGDNGYVCQSVNDFIAAIGEVKAGGAERYVDKAYHDIKTLYNTRTQAERYSEIYHKI